MTFTYTRTTEVAYLNGSDEYEEYGEDFEYEPKYEDIMDALSDIIFYNYFTGKDNHYADDIAYRTIMVRKIRSFLIDYSEDIYDIMCENYYEDLKEYFEEEAFESLE